MATYTDHPEIEVLDGRAWPKVSPKRTHALVQAAMLLAIKRCAGKTGQVGPEWRFDVGAADGPQTSLVPDLAFVRLERLAALPKELREQPPIAPDLAVEVRSPSHRAELLAAKIGKYLRAGTQLVLDVDPQTRRIAAHAADGVRTFAAGSTFKHPALPWLRFSVDEIFEDLDVLDG